MYVATSITRESQKCFTFFTVSFSSNTVTRTLNKKKTHLKVYIAIHSAQILICKRCYDLLCNKWNGMLHLLAGYSEHQQNCGEHYKVSLFLLILI